MNPRFSSILALALLPISLIAWSAGAQENGATFSGTGTIVAVPGRKVENPSSWYLESADGKRIAILQCGRVDYASFNRQEVAVEARWYQTVGICIDKVTSVAALNAARAQTPPGGTPFHGTGTIIAEPSGENPKAWYLDSADGKRTQIGPCGQIVSFSGLNRQQAEIEGRWSSAFSLVCVNVVTTAAVKEDRATLPARRKEIAQKYAPLIYLAGGESWLPSSIDYYAGYVRLDCANGKYVQEDIFGLGGLMLLPPDQCFFVPKRPLTGPYDQPSWLQGQDPSKTSVPIYVFIYPDESGEARDSTRMSFYAQYMTFYPYNYGKNACLSLAPADNCFSSRVLLGNHVADWELLTIRFREGKPVAVHVGAHGNDIPATAFTFRAPGWTASGNPAPQCTSGDPREDIFCAIQTVLQGNFTLDWEQDHPIAYSAEGSHGIYGWPGKHNYESIVTGEQLNDYTSKGVRWETWRNIVFADEPKYDYLLNRYNGRWGNPHLGKSACDLAPLPNFTCGTVGIPTEDYQLSDGPHLPDRKRDKPYMD